MDDADKLGIELSALAVEYTTTPRLRDRVEARIRQRARRRRAGVLGAATAAAVSAVLAVAVVGSAPDEPVAPQGPEETVGHPEPPQSSNECIGEEVLSADLDGDGQADRVFSGWVDGVGDPTDPGVGDHQLEVCTASGARATIAGVGNGEAIRAIDVEGDGRAELLTGGTTASATLLNVVVMVDGRLEVVVANGSPVQLREGTTASDGEAGLPTETAAFGCEDLTGDGRSDLVQVTASFTSDEVSWTKEAYTLDGATASTIGPETGTDPFTGDRLTFPASLTAPCGPDAGKVAADPDVWQSLVAQFLDDMRRGDLEAAAAKWTGYPEVTPQSGIAGRLPYLDSLVSDPTFARILASNATTTFVTPSITASGQVVTVLAARDGQQPPAAVAFLTGWSDELGRPGSERWLHRVPLVPPDAMDTVDVPAGSYVGPGDEITVAEVPVEGGARAFVNGTEVPVEVDHTNITMTVTVPADAEGDIAITIVASSPELPFLRVFAVTVRP